MNILILAALNRELQLLRQALSAVCRTRNDVNLQFSKIPVGQKCTDFVFPERILNQQVDLCINAGTAGSLADQLRLNDIFFPTRLIYEKTPDTPTPLSLELTGSLPAEWGKGILCTVSEPVVSADGRRAVLRQYGALAVDMEAALIGSACRSANRPFLVLKVISDTADKDTMRIFKENFDQAMHVLSQHLIRLIDLLIEGNH